MDLRLTGTRAIVTGGTKGIGRAIVELLAAEGASVAFCARTEKDVQAATTRLCADGATATGTAVDVCDAAALRTWVTQAAGELGGIDIVVSNVSALAIGDDVDSWQKTFQTDVLGTVGLIAAAMPELEKSTAGSIVTIASVSGREVDFAAGSYGAAKAAIIHTTPRGWLSSWLGKTSARTAFLLATPTSTAGCGSTSRPPTRSCTRRRSHSTRPAGWPDQTRSRERWCSWPARPPASSPAPTWSSMEPSPVECSSKPYAISA